MSRIRAPRWLKYTGLVVAGVAMSSSCSNKPKPPGELMLSLQTDMSIPKDIDAVWIEISKYGNTVFRNRYDVGPSGVKIPATLAVEADPGKSPPVTIRVISQQGTKTRTLREVVTTVPPDRTAMLRVPIEWLCDGSGEQIPGTSPPQFKNTCPAGQTCQSGTCTTSTVDSSKLPTFKPADVFGGGNGDGTGKCFDTLGCFSTPIALPVDTTTCTADVSDLMGGSAGAGTGGGAVDGVAGSGTGATGGAGGTGQAQGALGAAKLNIALELPSGGDGICDSNQCLVPLDGQSEWTVSNTTVTLPKAVCDRLQSGAAQAVVATLSCDTKTAATPTCGPWSSVSGTGPEDAGVGTGGTAGSSAGGASAGGSVGVAGSSAGGSVGIAGSSAAGSSAGGSGADGGTASPLGQACTTTSDCGGGLICVPENSTSFNGEGPPGGLCTQTCQTTADCQALAPNSQCVSEGGTTSYCLEGCTFGAANPSKCHSRSTTACSSLNPPTADGGVIDAGAQFAACIPVCGSDWDCGTGYCDLKTGLCSASPPAGGLPIGSSCDPSVSPSPCSGFCQPWGSGNLGFCSAPCTLSQVGCGYQAGTATAACLFSPAGASSLDLGFCGALCDCDSECQQGASCAPLPSNYVSATGRAGYCGLSSDVDGGLPTCPATDAGPG